MSRFENYSRTSKSYDATREPVGLEVILGCLASGARPLHEQVFLDVGCGTGSYLSRLSPSVAQAHGLELNPGMLAVAAEKLRDQATLHAGTATNLPFADASIDGVLCNQMIHHLDDGDPAFPNLQALLLEARRVLRPGGTLVVNTPSHAQFRDGFWFYALIPEAIQRSLPRFCRLDELANRMELAELVPQGRIVPMDAVLQGARYLDPSGPLDPVWRDGDSVWSLVTPEELDAVERRVRAMTANGTITAFIAQREVRRAAIGQMSFLFARA